MTTEKLTKGQELLDRINQFKSDVHSLDEAIKQNTIEGKKRAFERLVVNVHDKYGDTTYVIDTSEKEICGIVLHAIRAQLLNKIADVEKEFHAL